MYVLSFSARNGRYIVAVVLPFVDVCDLYVVVVVVVAVVVVVDSPADHPVVVVVVVVVAVVAWSIVPACRSSI